MRRDVVEQLLQTAKKLGKENDLRAMKDSDGATALDLAKEKREQLVQMRAPTRDEDADLDLKRNQDKIIEWLEKGVPSE